MQSLTKKHDGIDPPVLSRFPVLRFNVFLVSQKDTWCPSLTLEFRKGTPALFGGEVSINIK